MNPMLDFGIIGVTRICEEFRPLGNPMAGNLYLNWKRSFYNDPQYKSIDIKRTVVL